MDDYNILKANYDKMKKLEEDKIFKNRLKEYGLTVSELETFTKAKAEGRLRVLPAIPGSNAFRLCPRMVPKYDNERDCRLCAFATCPCPEYVYPHKGGWFVKPLYALSEDFIFRHRDEFGKILFATREAAEKVLGEEEIYINRNCPWYDWGRTAPREYGAFCEKKKCLIKDADCKNCKEHQPTEGDEGERK